MDQAPFTNREVKTMFSTLNEKLDGHTSVHGDILAQVKYTNGRVRFLEKMVWLSIGGIAVLSYFFSQDKLDLTTTSQADINSAVANSFDTYLNIKGYSPE